MAQKVTVSLVDDIDGGEAAETLVFGFDGVAYEIDLNHANASKFRALLQPYTERGRKAGRIATSRATNRVTHTPLRPVQEPRRSVPRAERYSDPDAPAMRSWALAHYGAEAIPVRGRMPEDIRKAYQAWDTPAFAALDQAVINRLKKVQVDHLDTKAPGIPEPTDEDYDFARTHARKVTTAFIKNVEHALANGGQLPPAPVSNHTHSVNALIRNGFGDRDANGDPWINGRAVAAINIRQGKGKQSAA